MVGDVFHKFIPIQQGILVLIVLVLVFQLFLLNFGTKSFGVGRNIEAFWIQNVINFQFRDPQNVMSNVIVTLKLFNDFKKFDYNKIDLI